MTAHGCSDRVLPKAILFRYLDNKLGGAMQRRDLMTMTGAALLFAAVAR